jgi:DDE superfamily endonuclease
MARGWLSWPPITGSARRAYRYLHEGIDVPAAAARRCAAGCWPPGRRAFACHRGRHADRHRPGPRPGREHDTTAPRTSIQALPLLAEWTDDTHAVLADLGYEGERHALTTPIQQPAGHRLSDDQRTVNLLHAATRAPAERGNSPLKTTFKALRRISLAPGASARSPHAALVLLHHQHGRTT